MLLFFVGLFLTAYSSRNPETTRIGSAIINQILFPFQTASTVVIRTTSHVWNGYIALIEVRKENRQLEREVSLLRSEVISLNEMQQENDELRQTLNMKEESALDGIVATVIGVDPSGWVQAISVDKGSMSGVRVGMAVTHAGGGVGQVTSVSLNSSRVLLLTDHGSGVDALIQRNRVRGVLGGRGGVDCELKFVEKEEDVIPGDVVVTSGLDMVYPKGVYIGKVKSVNQRTDDLFQRIVVEPAVDFSRLETVLIIIKEDL